MYIDGDVLEIDIDMDLEEVKSLKDFVKDRLEYIEEITFINIEQNTPQSSSLLQLLYVIKKEKPSIKIELLDNPFFDLSDYGKMYWITHE
jgi:hypothetical protein